MRRIMFTEKEVEHLYVQAIHKRTHTIPGN
jgi:hypothetical protein